MGLGGMQEPTKQTKIPVVQELDRSSVVTRGMCKICRSKVVTRARGKDNAAKENREYWVQC